jgi:1-acyl-sn-glycerol-3-phosphate acyltransferase
MAGQKKSGLSRVHSLVRTPVATVWIVFSTVLYSCAAFAVMPFSRRAVYWVALRWCKHLLAVCGARVTLEGREKLDRESRYVFVANHQSHLDIPCLMSVLPYHLTFIAKKELFAIPFFGWGITAMGHIAIDRSSARKARDSFRKAVRRLQNEDISVMIFPEGTRSRDGRVGEFKRGSFALAVDAGLPVVPVTIEGSIEILRKGSFLFSPGTVTITLHDPIEVEGYTRSALSETVRARITGHPADNDVHRSK